MIGNESEETNVDLRSKMVMDEAEEMRTLMKERGIGKVISYAADKIVNLKIALAKAQLVRPVRLSKGKKPKLPSGTKSARG
jgi:hypothetical protein